MMKLATSAITALLLSTAPALAGGLSEPAVAPAIVTEDATAARSSQDAVAIVTMLLVVTD